MKMIRAASFRFLIFAVSLVYLGYLGFAAGRIDALNPDLDITQYVQNIWRAPQFLPHDDVASIAQTPDGYLWIGTVEGLARFDGVRSVVFDKSNTPEIANNWIRSLLADREGRLWIGTFGGGLVLWKEGRFTRFGAEAGLPSDTILSLYEDRAGHILVGTLGSGVFRFQDSRFVAEPGTVPLSELGVRAIVQDQQDVLWLGTDSGLFELSHGAITRHWTRKEGLSDDIILSLAVDRKGLWIGTEKAGLCRLVQGKITTITTREGLTHFRIWSLCVDKDENVWIGTDGGGLDRLSGSKLTAFTTKNGLTNDFVWAIHEGSEGTLWIGTNGGGLNQLKEGAIVPYTTREGLPSDFVWSIMRSQDGSLWIGGENSQLARIQDGSISTVRLPEEATGNAKVLYQTRDGSIWIGGNQGLDLWKDGRIAPINIPEIRNKTVNALLEDREGALWIGTNVSGLKRLKDGRVTEFSRKQELSNDSITSIIQARDGSIWIGTLGGITHLADGRFTVFTGKDGLPSEYVTSVFEGPDGAIWAGTRGGLARIRNGRVQSITSKQGLFDDAIMCAILDDQGMLWMGSNRGIFGTPLRELGDVLNARSSRVHSVAFGLDDGMRSVEVNSSGSSVWKDSDGRIWFATRGGVASMQPAQLKFKPEPPRVLIEEVIADGRRLEGAGPWRLPAGTFSVEIHFTALNLLSPSRVQFKRRLEGFDPDWAGSGTDRTAHYTNLPYGRYKFQVMAIDNQGVNLAGAERQIEILPFFYERIWFRTLIALVFILAGPLFYLYRTRMLTRQKAELERLVAERTIEVQAANERLEQLARQDALTAVANRRRLDEALEEEWRRAYRSGTPLALLLIDVDFFKAYNDQLGHQQGDDCLRTLAGTIADVCKRAGEVVARYGGEEFAVLLPNLTQSAAETTAERIRHKVQELSMPHPQSIAPVVTVSIGVAWAEPARNGSVADLVGAADRALYNAKHGGRNRVEKPSDAPI